ncbi:MAG: CRISPR-associated protein Cas4 [Puniceicoccales bacterium]
MPPVEPLSVPLSALQHYLYCPRQCALIHLEREWSENTGTAEGRVMHEKAHSGRGESRPGVRITRSLEVSSTRHGLHGVCDIVEIHDMGKVVPVEYKRGRPKAHRADEIQLCGQAICLEETLGGEDGSIAEGCLFYGKLQRRTTVELDAALRALTLDVAEKTRVMMGSGVTPPAEYSPKRCERCSLLSLCQPRSQRLRQGVAAWFSRSVKASLSR